MPETAQPTSNWHGAYFAPSSPPTAISSSPLLLGFCPAYMKLALQSRKDVVYQAELPISSMSTARSSARKQKESSSRKETKARNWTRHTVDPMRYSKKSWSSKGMTLQLPIWTWSKAVSFLPVWPISFQTQISSQHAWPNYRPRTIISSSLRLQI